MISEIGVISKRYRLNFMYPRSLKHTRLLAQIHRYRNMKVVELHQLKKLIDVLLSVHIFQVEVRPEYQEAPSKE